MNSNKKNIYCIDSSALITMQNHYSRRLMPDLWKYLEELFNDGTLISHKVVFDEIVPKQGAKDSLAKWITPFKGSFQKITQDQLDLLSDILANFPRLVDEDSEKDQADPFLIAMLVSKMNNLGLFGKASNYVIVSAENERSSIKIPAACRHYDIRHMNINQFFDSIGLQFSVSKS